MKLSIDRLKTAVFAMAVLDVLLLLVFFRIGCGPDDLFAAERFTFHAVTSDSAHLAWSRNTESDLSGYRLYSAGSDTKMVWSTQDTTILVKVPMTRFWETVGFCLTALDNSGNESAPSDTISTILCKAGPRLVGDIDGIAGVNLIDKMIYFVAAGTRRGDLRYNERADFNGDGAVNLLDKVIMLINAGKKR
jgi:hypothetical protein